MLRLRLKLLVRALSPRWSADGRRNWLVIGIFLIFVALTSRISTELFETLRLTPEIGPALAFRVVSMANLSFCLMLIFSSIVSAAMVLYMNPENDLLFAMPISRVRIFAVRYLESMSATGWMVFLFGTPIAVGLGRSFIAGWEYVVVAALSLLGLIVLPTAFGVFLLCLSFVWIPRHRVKSLSFMVAALAAYWVVTVASRVDIGILFQMEFDPALQMSAMLAAIELPSHPYTPDTLAAQAMSAMAKGEALESLKKLGLLWVESAAGLGVLMGISYPLFWHGWTRNEQRGIRTGSLMAFSLAPFKRSVFFTLCLKDLKFLCRNITEWTQMLVLLTLIFVQLVNIRDLPLDQAYLKNFVSFVNLAVSVLLVLAVSVRLVYPTFSLEGPNAYVLKSMPLTSRQILRAKFWTNLIPLAILSQLLLYLTNRQTGVGIFFFIFSHGVSFLQTIVIVHLALYASLAWPPQGHSSLERAAGSTGGLLLMILGSLYIVGCVAYFTAPIYRILLMVEFTPAALSKPLLASYVIFFLVHVALCAMLGRLSERRFAAL